MKRTRLRRFALVGAALLAAPMALHAQNIVGVQNLSFGNVIPGVPTTVLRTDAVRAGQFRISGTGLYRAVTLTFTLPTVMNGPAGATMPITFSNTDGGYTSFLVGTNTAFNPHNPYSTGVVFGSATVFLGGTAHPSPTQRGGSYSGNIVLTAIF